MAYMTVNPVVITSNINPYDRKRERDKDVKKKFEVKKKKELERDTYTHQYPEVEELYALNKYGRLLY